MPNNEGLLSPEERDRIAKKLAELGVDPKCQACHIGEWEVAGHVAIAPSWFPPARMVFETFGAGYPCVLTFCKNCGLFRWHGAVTTGALSGPEIGAIDDTKEAGDGQ